MIDIPSYPLIKDRQEKELTTDDKQKRLENLISIAQLPRAQKVNDDRAKALRDALYKNPGKDRLTELKTFFDLKKADGTDVIHGGWKSKYDKLGGLWAEDEHFLLWVPQQATTFWFDW